MFPRMLSDVKLVLYHEVPIYNKSTMLATVALCMNAPIEKLFQCVFNKKTRKSVLKTYSFNVVRMKALPLVAAKKTTVV